MIDSHFGTSMSVLLVAVSGGDSVVCTTLVGREYDDAGNVDIVKTVLADTGVITM